MTTKTLFDAVEAELRNARAAISNAGAYLDMLKDTVETLEAKVRIIEDVEIIPIVKALPKGEDVLKALRPGVKTEDGEHEIPLAVEPKKATLMYGFEIRSVNNELTGHMKLL